MVSTIHAAFSMYVYIQDPLISCTFSFKKVPYFLQRSPGVHSTIDPADLAIIQGRCLIEAWRSFFSLLRQVNKRTPLMMPWT